MAIHLKILIISDSIDINDSSGSKGRVALIENMSKVGFEVKVLHYTRRDISLPGILCVAVPERKMTLNYLLGKTLIVFQRITKIPAVQFFEKRVGFSFLFFNDSQSIKNALDKEDPAQYNWIMTLSKGASFRSHYAVLNSLKWHAKWLAYIHDPFPFHRYPEPYAWYMPGYEQKEQFFHKLANKAKYVIFPSLLLQEWMEQWYPKMKGKGVVIPHQIPDAVDEKKSVPLYFLKDGFTLLHAGNLMKPRPPHTLVKAFELFLKRTPGAVSVSQLLLVGPASYHQSYLDQAAAAIPQLYVSAGYVDYNEVQSLQENASVNIILEADAESSPFLPGKFPHCIASGSPILLLGPNYSECKRLLGEDYLYWSELNDVDRIFEKLVIIYKIWKEDPNGLKQNFDGLTTYLSEEYLKKQFMDLKNAAS